MGRENSAIQIFQTFFFLFSFQVGESTFLSFIDFFGCTESFKKKISVDFIVQCVWLLEHVKQFSYYAKTQRVFKHMDSTGYKIQKI